MNSVERVIRAIEFRNPDRIPIQHFYSPEALMTHKNHLINIFQRYPPDVGPSEFEPPKNGKKSDWLLSRELTTIQKKGSEFEKQYLDPTILYRDRWGCVWKKGGSGEGRYVAKPALEKWEYFENYEFPEPFPNEEEFKKEKERVTEEKEKYHRYMLGYTPYREYIFGGFTPWFRLTWLRGMQNLFMDIAKERRELPTLIDGVFKKVLEAVDQTLELGMHGVYFSDDWGGENNLLINPSYWRKVFKPRYKEIFDLVHQRDRHVFFHTDGNTLEIISDLIEIGVDVLNPEIPIMDSRKLSRITRGKVCILTELDRRQLLPHGTPEDIKEEIKRQVKLFGTAEGGIIGRGKIAADVPLSNVEAMLSAFCEGN